MTVDSKYVIKQYTADGGDTYTFDTESIGDTAIQVWIIRDGVRTQVTNSYYDLTLDESHSPIYKRGTVKFTMELPVVGDIVSIERSTPIYNELTLVDGDPFPSEQFEHMMDRICFIQQEIEGHYCDCRAICTPPAITVQPYELLDPAYTFTFEATGTGPLAYQWQQDNAGDGIFVDMVGETNIQLTVPDTSTNQYRVVVTNACGTAISDPVQLEQTTPTCQALDDAFVNIGNELWFMWRGYEQDIINAPSGQYSGAIPNMATNTLYTNNGDSRNLFATDRLDVGWNNCDDEQVRYFNGNNTGSGSYVSHARDRDSTPNYNGMPDAHTQGCLVLPGLDREHPDASSNRQLASISWSTFIFQVGGVIWNPGNGKLGWECGDLSDQSESAWVFLPEDPDFLGYDYGAPAGMDNRIWRHIAWKIERTNSSLTITFYKDGVAQTPLTITTNRAGTPLSNVSWWETDDGSNSGNRTFIWARGGSTQYSYRQWYLLYCYAGPLTVSDSSIAAIQTAFETQTPQ